MSDCKLHFPESNQSYQCMDFIETEKGGVRQIISNLNIALMNPKYCLKEKSIKDSFSMILLQKKLNFKERLLERRA